MVDNRPDKREQHDEENTEFAAKNGQQNLIDPDFTPQARLVVILRCQRRLMVTHIGQLVSI